MSSRLQRRKSCCCFGCCTGKKLTISNRLLVARATFGTIAAIHVLITFILLGAQMDSANFPGSNLILEKYQSDDPTNTFTYDIDRSGQNVEVLNGYIVTDPLGCTNRITNASSSEKGIQKTSQKLCAAAEGQSVQIDNWSDGWIVAPDCTRSRTNPNVCAPFGYSSPLSWFGRLTFFALALQVILFCAHTCVAVYEQAKEGKSGSTFTILARSSTHVKLTLGLTVTWCIVGVVLFVASAGAWSAFCDKIDTGLGRRAKEGRACAGSMCVYPFSSLFATMVVAAVWYHIPHLLTWCGILEAV